MKNNKRYLSKKIRKAKQEIAFQVSKLPLSSEFFGPPKGWVATTKDWMKDYDSIDLDDPIKFYEEIYPQETLLRSAPKTLSGQVHWKFSDAYQYHISESFVASFSSGRVFSRSGTVITPDDKVLWDVSDEFGIRVPRDLTVFSTIKLPRLVEIDGSAIVLGVPGGSSFFHWVFDVLPRLHLLSKSNLKLDSDVKYIFSGVSSKFSRECLDILGIESSKVLDLSKTPHIKANRLILPSLAGNTGNPPKWACDFLNRFFVEKNFCSREKTNRRFYICRDKAKGRKIINSEEFSIVLHEYGFETIFLEDLTFLEQVKLFSTAEAIVSPHGAGLANIVFSNPGTKLLEIFSPKYINVCYWSISNHQEIDYYYMIGNSSDDAYSSSNQNTEEDILDNIIVDIKLFLKLLEYATIHPRALRQNL